MKIKIDKNGYLWLERAGKMKAVKCPEDHYTEKEPYRSVSFHKHWSCGDWCATFGGEEPYPETEGIAVTLCKMIHFCSKDDFTDERGGK